MPKMPDLKKSKVPTMIELDTDLWLQIKRDCLERGITMKDLISQLLKKSYKNKAWRVEVKSKVAGHEEEGMS